MGAIAVVGVALEGEEEHGYLVPLPNYLTHPRRDEARCRILLLLTAGKPVHLYHGGAMNGPAVGDEGALEALQGEVGRVRSQQGGQLADEGKTQTLHIRLGHGATTQVRHTNFPLC